MSRDQIFELAWILPSIALPVAMLVAITVTAFGMGIHVPNIEGSIDPTTLAQSAQFKEPGIVQTAPKKYEVTMVAQTWQFRPNDIKVPAGSDVRFTITSQDVIHGIRIQGTNINAMIVPGVITRVSARFDTPGEYLMVCHEYCGVGHHLMGSKIIVEP
ncbi:MAG: cytochrome c oxidase subunit II [Chloroflexota bacterium]